MNKRTFTEYISESNFRELFIREMGWNNPRGQQSFDLAIEGDNYTFQIIAERNGFQVITCQVAEIPSSSMCKKIDTRLRRQANDYICIYHLPHSQHHLLVVPVKKVEKRDLVLVEYETAERAGFLLEKVDDLTFDPCPAKMNNLIKPVGGRSSRRTSLRHGLWVRGRGRRGRSRCRSWRRRWHRGREVGP